MGLASWYSISAYGIFWGKKATSPLSVPIAQGGVKVQDGLGPLLMAEDVTSKPFSTLFQSPHLENKEINTQLERFNLPEELWES